jgi:hypothetical protein
MNEAVEQAMRFAASSSHEYALIGDETCVRKNFIALDGGLPASARSKNEPRHGF